MTKDKVIRRLRVLGGREPGPNVFDAAADMLLGLAVQQVPHSLNLDVFAHFIERELGPKCAEYDPNCCTCIAWTLLEQARQPVQQTCTHPWEHIGINADGIHWCTTCFAQLRVPSITDEDQRRVLPPLPIGRAQSNQP